jgi:hypothetical protein
MKKNLLLGSLIVVLLLLIFTSVKVLLLFPILLLIFSVYCKLHYYTWFIDKVKTAKQNSKLGKLILSLWPTIVVVIIFVIYHTLK